MKYSHKTFRPLPEVNEAIEQIPYGERSDWINAAIINGSKQAGREIRKKEETTKISEQQSQPSTSALVSATPATAPALSANLKNKTSSPTPNIQNLLRKLSRRSV